MDKTCGGFAASENSGIPFGLLPLVEAVHRLRGNDHTFLVSGDGAGNEINTA